MSRRGYLDWLRGIAVLIMIEAHAIDSWTLLSERDRVPFGYAMILGGFGAPIFLFLAGLAMMLAAGGRMRKGASPAEAAEAVRRRGWQIFGLAFLFRLQSYVLGGGAPLDTLLKVDILNIMGLAMVGAAVAWGVASRDLWRAALLAAIAVALTMLTPLVRAAPWLAVVPDPMEWYLRPFPGRTTFTIFPWAGFLFAGAALGVWLNRSRTPESERRLILMLAIAGPAIGAAGYAASFLPPIYAQTSFWTSSPTFFFLRLGVLVSLVPIAYVVSSGPGSGQGRTRVVPGSEPGLTPGGRGGLRAVNEPLEYFGRASLFVYWIHVEMVYGVLSAGLHKRLTLEQSALAFALFSVFLFGVAKAKDWVVGRPRTQPGRSSSQPARG